MANIWEDNLAEAVYIALGKAEKNRTDADVNEVLTTLADAYGPDGHSDNADIVATRIRQECLARLA